MYIYIYIYTYTHTKKDPRGLVRHPAAEAGLAECIMLILIIYIYIYVYYVNIYIYIYIYIYLTNIDVNTIYTNIYVNTK